MIGKVNSISKMTDENLIPENIRKDVTIFDVTGTLESISAVTLTSEASGYFFQFDDFLPEAVTGDAKFKGAINLIGTDNIYGSLTAWLGNINPDSLKHGRLNDFVRFALFTPPAGVSDYTNGAFLGTQDREGGSSSPQQGFDTNVNYGQWAYYANASCKIGDKYICIPWD